MMTSDKDFAPPVSDTFLCTDQQLNGKQLIWGVSKC